MLKTPDEAVRVCLAKLGTREFEPLIAYLKTSQGEDLAALMVIQEEHTIRHYQGRTQAIHDLLGRIENASKTTPKS